MMIKAAIRYIFEKLGITYKSALITEIRNEHPAPEEICDGHLYLVKGGKMDKWACFRCPGGCGEIIKLSLSTSRKPRWAVSSDWLQRPTVTPSVRQLNQCQCHFWIKQGQIDWCLDSGKKKN